MDVFADALETVPGLALVFAIAALFLMRNESEIAEAIRVFFVAWVLYRASSRLDWFFDVAYGPGPRGGAAGAQRGLRRLRELWWRLRMRLVVGFDELETRRRNAIRGLGEKYDPNKGLYASAKKAIGTERWDKHVKRSLDYSKAFRAFILPLLVVFIVIRNSNGPWGDSSWFKRFLLDLGDLNVFRGFREDFHRAAQRLDFLSDPMTPAVLCLLCVLGYVWLRLRHMNKLYDLAAE
jgi:hypothetical protein